MDKRRPFLLRRKGKIQRCRWWVRNKPTSSWQTERYIFLVATFILNSYLCRFRKLDHICILSPKKKSSEEGAKILSGHVDLGRLSVCFVPRQKKQGSHIYYRLKMISVQFLLQCRMEILIFGVWACSTVRVFRLAQPVLANLLAVFFIYDKLSDQWHVSVPPCHQNSDGW